MLASPFVRLGTNALQNLFRPLFFLTVRAETNGRTALQLAWLVLVLGPVVLEEIVTGRGYGSNTIYVLLGLWWLVRTKHRDVAAITWGVALASRANFLFLVPLALGDLLNTPAGERRCGRCRAPVRRSRALGYRSGYTIDITSGRSMPSVVYSCSTSFFHIWISR